MLERYPFQDIGHVLTPVGRALHVFQNLAPFYYVGGIAAILKKFRHGAAKDFVRRVFKSVNLYAMRQNLLQFGLTAYLSQGHFHFL
jgi:hypothetical protein